MIRLDVDVYFGLRLVYTPSPIVEIEKYKTLTKMMLLELVLHTIARLFDSPPDNMSIMKNRNVIVLFIPKTILVAFMLN
jgi:hypothetical protein